MNIPFHRDQAPLKIWQQLDELCADSFAVEYPDPALVRHGRTGQVQHGVDILPDVKPGHPLFSSCEGAQEFRQSLAG